jgi:hypothetical protein
VLHGSSFVDRLAVEINGWQREHATHELVDVVAALLLQVLVPPRVLPNIIPLEFVARIHR